MPNTVAREDVLMFIKSTRVIEYLTPPDARDAAIAGLTRDGHYTFSAAAGSYSIHGGIFGSTVFDSGRYGNKPILDKELPEEEVEATRAVFQAARAKGRTVHVVDVGRESALREYISEHLHHLKAFPVLMRPDGRRLEGCANCTPEKLEKFLAD
jgi:hypothetical protein